MRFTEIFKTALYKFSNYPALLTVRRAKTFLYVVFLAFIMLLGIVVTIAPFIIQAGGPTKIMRDNIPEFTIKNGKLKCEKSIDFKDEENSIYINVDDTLEGVPQLPQDYAFAVAVSKTDVRSTISGIDGINFKKTGDFNKTDVINWFGQNKYTLYMAAAGYSMLFFVVAVFITALLYAAFGAAANVLMIRSPLRFMAIFKLALFSMTLPVLLTMLFAFVKMRFAFFAPFLTMFYLIKGIWACKKSDGYIIEVL